MFASITDVEGVEVGFSTIVEGDSIRTGGTEKALQNVRCFAN